MSVFVRSKTQKTAHKMPVSVQDTTNEPSAKRKRLSPTAHAPETTTLQPRLIVLKMAETEGTFQETRSREISFFLPQYVMEQMLLYKSKLESALANADTAWGPEVIDDEYLKNGYGICELRWAINYLGGAPLPALNTERAAFHLNILLYVCDICQFLEIKTLEDAILDHIRNCEELPLETFLLFAQKVYSNDGRFKRLRDSPIAKLVHDKLIELKPRLVQKGLDKEIAEWGGGLGVVFYEISTSNASADVAIKTEK